MTITNINKLTTEDCENAFASLPLQTKQWLFLILSELQSARIKHPWWPTDILHRVAIIGEENGELTRAAVQAFYQDGNWEEMHIEAIQTASTCLRFLLETDLSKDEFYKRVLQATCLHEDYEQTGEGHNKKFYKCKHCGFETWA